MKGREPGLHSEVRGRGGYYGDCIRVTITNETGRPATVEVPLGLLLVPGNPSVQTMVAAGGERLDAPPGTSAHAIKAFCGERHDSVPGANDLFSSGGRASGELLERVQEIFRSQRFDRLTQDQIWQISDGLNLSRGAGGATNAEKDATAAAVLSLLLLIGWQLLNDRIHVPIPAAAPSTDPDGEGERPDADASAETESESDRPAWSLMRRGSDDDLFDEQNQKWVGRHTHEGQAILEARRKEMEARGYNYDAERDAFVEHGLEYDAYSDSYRRVLEQPELLDIKAETGDASRIDHGIDTWRFRRDLPWSLFEKDRSLLEGDPEAANRSLIDRFDYLEKLEQDVKSEHEAVNEQLKSVEEQKEKDPWLEEQLRQRREAVKEKMRQVQGEKLDLTQRVHERSRQYDSWGERQKSSWTWQKVGKELSDIYAPDPESLRPLFERTLELRNRLQQAIKDQPALFRDVDETVARIKAIAARMQEARDKGHVGTLRTLQREMDTARARLRALHGEMRLIQRTAAQWEAGSHLLTTTAAMTAVEYIGKARAGYEIGKSGVQFLKPSLGPRRITSLEPLQKSRTQPEFYVVDKDGNIQPLKGADAADFKPGKGQLVVSRDPYSGKLTDHQFGAGGRGQSLADGQKSLLHQKAESGLANRPVGKVEPGRRYAGPAGLTTAEDGSITYTAPDEAAPSVTPSPKPRPLPKDLRELKDLVDSENLSRMVRSQPNAAQQNAESVEDLAERLRRGERPHFSRKDLPQSDESGASRRSSQPAGPPNRFKDDPDRLGEYPDELAKEIASRHPDFARIDKAIREAYRESGAARGADDVVNPEPGERFMELAEKKGVRPQDWENWRKALKDGDWHAIDEHRPSTVKVKGSGPSAVDVGPDDAARGSGPMSGAGAGPTPTDGGPDVPEAPGGPPPPPHAPVGPAPSHPAPAGDLRDAVPERGTFKTERARMNYEKMMTGKDPDFTGAFDDKNAQAGWRDREWMQRQQHLKAGEKVETAADRLEYWRQKDPHFKEMQRIFDKAESEARDRMIKEILPDVEAQLQKEGWAPGQPGYSDELGRRVGADLRIHSGEKVQNLYYDNLFREKPDLTPFDENQYFDKLYDYSNRPIPDQPEAPVAPRPMVRTVVAPAPMPPSASTPPAPREDGMSFARMLQGFLKPKA